MPLDLGLIILRESDAYCGIAGSGGIVLHSAHLDLVWRNGVARGRLGDRVRDRRDGNRLDDSCRVAAAPLAPAQHDNRKGDRSERDNGDCDTNANDGRKCRNSILCLFTERRIAILIENDARVVWRRKR